MFLVGVLPPILPGVITAERVSHHLYFIPDARLVAIPRYQISRLYLVSSLASHVKDWIEEDRGGMEASGIEYTVSLTRTLPYASADWQ